MGTAEPVGVVAKVDGIDFPRLAFGKYRDRTQYNSPVWSGFISSPYGAASPERTYKAGPHKQHIDSSVPLNPKFAYEASAKLNELRIRDTRLERHSRY